MNKEGFDLGCGLEAVLFLADEPLNLRRLAEITGADEEVVETALVRLGDKLEVEGRGVQLRKLSDGYRLYTHPGYAPMVEAYLLSVDRRRLTQAALETLAIVAYKQPVTRAEVSRIRGVNAEAALNSLTEKGFVREVGRDSSPGNPLLFGTTRYFLEQLGLAELAELPALEGFEPDEQTKEQIAISFRSDPI